MALGGFMFEGRFCNRGTTTDTEWALLMHKTKVAAFLAANTRASAGWAVDMADSNDGDYHKLDPVGYNYVTRFENASAGGYLYILTLCKFMYSASASDTQAGYASVAGFLYDSSSYSYGAGATNHIRLSKTRVGLDVCLNYYYTGAISPVVAAGNFGVRSQSSYFTGPVGSRTFMASSVAYFGYAVKGADVICLSGGSASQIQVSVASIGGFSNITSPGDPYNIFIVNLSSVNSNGAGEAEAPERSGVSCMPWSCGADGYTTAYTSGLYSFPIALTSNHTDEMSFNSVYMSGVTTNQSITGVPLCYGKGTIKTELLSTSFYSQTNYPSYANHQTVANGKFMAVLGETSTNAKYGFSGNQGMLPSVRQYVFVGWDESNPPLTEASSWTEYTPEAPADQTAPVDPVNVQ